MALFRKKRKDDELVDPNERSPESGLKYKDLSVLGQLMKHGADLTQPRHVLHFLYFPERDAAEAASAAARSQGYEANVRDPLPEYPEQWGVVAEKNDAVLDIDTVRSSGDFFDALAQTHGGEYDGWEASV